MEQERPEEPEEGLPASSEALGGDFERPQALEGILVPLLTPFDEDGEVDRSGLAQLIDFYVHAGVHGILALGSAGQGPAMRADQRRSAAEVIVDRVGGRVPIMIHVGTVDVQTTVQLARHAAALRPAALAVSPPSYYSDHTPFEVAAHFAAVAEAVSTPIYIYDSPRYVGIAVSPASAYRIAQAVPSVCGIVAEDSGLDRVLHYLRALPHPFAVFTGSIECLLPSVPYGLAGVCSAPCSAFPELCVSLWRTVASKQYEEAFPRQRQLNDIAALIDRFAASSGRNVYRETLGMRGLALKRYPRWPTQELEEARRQSLRGQLQALGAFELPQTIPEGEPLWVEAALDATEEISEEPASVGADLEPANSEAPPTERTEAEPQL